ncbi:MAG: oligopeptide transporter, OPT family [Candidatus Latescibacteria bacterium]|nr:oligopeptide transporter, OPT family [Candidatus Latescibacterota bacterium]
MEDKNRTDPGRRPESFIPAATLLPEITLKAVLLGILLSVILAGANAYLGLFAGMTVSASIPAAVISMGVLKLFRRSNILENNIVQTAASAGESLAAGVIFTIPALVLMGYWTEFDVLWITLIAALGGVIGVLFTIPLRRALIVEGDLKFPEGLATAEVLKTGEAGGREIRYIAWSAIVGALFKFGEAGLRLWSSAIETGRFVGAHLVYFGSNLSPALLSVGYIVGLNISVLVFLGGAISWLIAIPIYVALFGSPDPSLHSAVEVAGAIWSTKIRYMGVGAMVVGGLWALIRMRGSLMGGIRSGLRAYGAEKNDPEAVLRTERDAPMKGVLLALILAVIPLFVLASMIVGNMGVSALMAVVMLIAGFLFSAVAAYMAGLVGSSNNPISGVTIATILCSALLLLALLGRGSAIGPAAAVFIGAVVCCSAAIAGDNMQDLKAGYLLGATPWKQQIMQIVGTLSASLVIAPVLILLMKAYGIGPRTVAHPHALTAPQATLMASVARGVFHGGLPWALVAIGAGIAVAVILFDLHQERLGAGFRAPVLAVAVGIYLPFELSVPIFVGGLISHFAHAALKRKRSGNEQEPGGHGLLFASGLITGEALVGILMAIPIVVSGRGDILAIMKNPIGAWPGLLLLIGVAYALYRVAKKQ